MMRYLLGFSFTLCMLSLAYAGDCRPHKRAVVANVQQVVVPDHYDNIQFVDDVAVKFIPIYSDIVGYEQRQSNFLNTQVLQGDEFINKFDERMKSLENAILKLSNSQGGQSTLNETEDGFVPDDVVQVFANHCKTCHTGPSSKGGFAIFADNGDIKLLAPQKMKIWDRVRLSVDDPLVMPPNPRPILSDEDFSLVDQWVWSDEKVNEKFRECLTKGEE